MDHSIADTVCAESLPAVKPTVAWTATFEEPAHRDTGA
jgi:hypothetical protein